MTLRTRLVFGYATLVVATLFVLLLVGRVLLVQAVHEQVRSVHEEEFAQLAKHSGKPGEEAALANHMGIEDDKTLKFVLRAADGRLVFVSPGLDDRCVALAEAVPGAEMIDLPDYGRCRVTAHSLDGYAIRIITPLGIPMAVHDKLLKIGLTLLAAGLAISLILGGIFSRWALIPIAQIEATARRIGVDNLSERIPPAIASQRDELGRLAMLLNAMLERLQESVERIRRFTAEVSHELRTPLSVVRLNAERIRDLPESPDSVRELAGEQIEEIERLNRFVGNLLNLAKLDAGAVPMEFRTVAWRDFLEDFTEDAALLAEDRGRRFTGATEPQGEVRMDAGWMRQVLLNLLSNALRVSPEDGLVTLGVTSTQDGWEIVMEDEGPGLSEERLAAIFDRYVRFGDENGPDAGAGIGLAISRSIVAQHGGSIRAENRRDRSGLRIIVRLPAAL